MGIKEYEKPKRKSRRKVRKSFIAVLLVFLISIFAILCMTVLFPIATVTVKYDGTHYTVKEISKKCGIKTGENLIMLSGAKISETVERELPYIGELKVKKQFPDSVVLTAEETAAYYCIPNGKKYCILDSSFKVLEKSADYSETLVCVDGLKLSRAQTGECAESEDKNFKQLEKICNGLEKHGISVQYIDFSVSTDVCLYVADKYKVELGTMADIDEKLNFLYKMLDDMKEKGKDYEGSINLGYYSSKGEGYFTRGEFKPPYYAAKK